MASRVALDAQGRLVLRENGKIILPFEHFANAVMLKHMNGPHGLHLGLEGTVRAVCVQNIGHSIQKVRNCLFMLGDGFLYNRPRKFRDGKRIHH